MVLFKDKPQKRTKLEDMRRELVEGMFYGIFNMRLYERSQTADSPYLGAFAFDSSFTQNMGGFALAAIAAPEKMESALSALLDEGSGG